MDLSIWFLKHPDSDGSNHRATIIGTTASMRADSIRTFTLAAGKERTIILDGCKYLVSHLPTKSS